MCRPTRIMIRKWEIFQKKFEPKNGKKKKCYQMKSFWLFLLTLKMYFICITSSIITSSIGWKRNASCSQHGVAECRLM